jgi:RNA polymerase sigma-70 factor (ECF subfamily)
MRYSDRTDMGGPKSDFPTTRWSEIGEAKTLDEDHRREVIDDLARKYWKPVYCYLRRKGYDNEPAKDLTQGFFHELVIGNELIQRSSKAKGRFRTFLLTSLNHYVINVHRADARKKRRPAGTMLSVEMIEEGLAGIRSKDMEPGEAFTYVWALELLQEVLAEVESGCRKDGKEKHWELFCTIVLKPIMDSKEAESLSGVCSRLDIPNKRRALYMMKTMKERFRAVMRSRVRPHVDSDEDVEKEIHDLMKILSRNRPDRAPA